MDFLIANYGIALGASSGPFWLSILAFALVGLSLAYRGAPMAAFFLLAGGASYVYGASFWLLVALDVAAVVLLVPPIRRVLISQWVMKALKGSMPPISQTEKTAIEAGTVWVEGELFSGKPDLARMLAEAYPKLSKDEQAFLDGPCEELCRMTDDWDSHVHRDLAPEVWDFVKKEKFMGLIVPKEYGGMGFSPVANSAVVQKMGSRSVPLAVTVMVPNSLGPAELLAHYGTKQQKEHYLPRLADGREVPCFALTEPTAGSDAASIKAGGVVFKDGKDLKIRLNWDKRYITLGTISTLLGLAFNLEDPENLLGKGENPGITCALIPTDTPGVDISHRHDPLGVPFVNSALSGRDVVVSVDQIIGGKDGAGNGWRMLMECLAAGRAISLPAMSVGGSKLAARAMGAYAGVRKQFGLPIGKFEGIEEPLARIAGYNYLLDAMRLYTCGGLEGGGKPAVISAVAKYQGTEIARQVVNDAMDVSGGAGISRGPRNLLASRYIGMPVSITVEGANILTRTLMIFGQGAIRAHPYAYKEMTAILSGDLKTFDRLFWAHVGFVFRNATRAKLLFMTRGLLASSPVSGPTAKYWRKLSWASATFAFMADVAMGTLAGDLKRKGKLTGRFADILSWMYIGAAVLKRWEADGRPKEDLPLVDWSMQTAFANIQEAMLGLYQNMPFMNIVWRGPVAFGTRLNPIGTPPPDWLGHKLAKALQTPGAQRDRLTAGIYLTDDPEEALGRLENALNLSLACEPVLGKIKKAIRKKELPRARPETLLDEAVEKKVISKKEAAQVREAEEARYDAITVDSFTQEEYMAGVPDAPRAAIKPKPAPKKKKEAASADDSDGPDSSASKAKASAKPSSNGKPAAEKKKEAAAASNGNGNGNGASKAQGDDSKPAGAARKRRKRGGSKKKAAGASS